MNELDVLNEVLYALERGKLSEAYQLYASGTAGFKVGAASQR